MFAIIEIVSSVSRCIYLGCLHINLEHYFCHYWDI